VVGEAPQHGGGVGGQVHSRWPGQGGHDLLGQHGRHHRAQQRVGGGDHGLADGADQPRPVAALAPLHKHYEATWRDDVTSKRSCPEQLDR
jgi:hypothetical protein